MSETVQRRTVSTRHTNLMPAACVIFAVWIIAAILSSRCLYADGAHEFVRVLEAQTFVSLMWSRHFAFYIYEFPLVLAIKLGVTDLAWLRFAFGLGCFLPWPLAMICCRWISKKHFWLVVFGCAAGYLNAAFMAVGEHILAHALFWPALFVILFAEPVKKTSAAILLAAAIGMLFSYESQFILAFPLALLALWRARQEKKGNRRWNWILFLVAAALYTAAITIGLCGALMPEVPSNLAGFKSSTTVMFKHPGWTLAWTMIWAGLTLAAAFLEIFWRAISSKAGIYILFGMFGVWATWPLLAPDRLDNGLQCDYRILDVLVPMALLPAALILRFRPQWFERRQKRVTQLAAALLMTQSLWQISATINWYRDVIWMREILATKHGIVSLRSTALAVDGMEGRELYRDAMGGRFDWVWPCLSIALSPKPKINCLIYSEVFMNAETPRKYWQPFDPLEPKTLPHLEHYGVDYSNYVAALSNKSKPSP